MKARLMLARLAVVGLLLCLAGLPAGAADRSERFEFTTMLAHWAEYGHPDYLDFVAETKPDLVQLGFYGAHFWSLADTKHGKGYPAHFPEQGYQANRDWFARMNREVHARGAKVVGHMNVKFLVGDPMTKDGPTGFFKFYRDQWDVELLGPKPVEDPLTMLEIDVKGELISNKKYGIGGMQEYWACLNNPNWRKVLKAWTKHGLDQGVDGFIANYFYRHDCHCEHCVSGFKSHLRSRFNAEQLKQQLGIENLDQHRFTEIVAWHDPKESTPLRREMLSWSQIGNKRAFDEVFVEYGRSLKPDLIAAQWNHISNFSQINGDERCLLPAEHWGRSEDYLWYSTGASAHYTDLENNYLGEGTLQARYIRGAFDDKPFTLGKYESTRTRVAIAELAANGGAPLGFYARISDPLARQEIARYFGFIRRNAETLKAHRPAGEAVLLFPRSEVHTGNVEAVAKFREIGTTLLNEHVAFDIIPDDLTNKLAGDNRPKIDVRSDDWRAALKAIRLSRFDAPLTVRVSLTRPAAGANELDVQLVNYNRIEPRAPKSAGGGIATELPLATVAAIRCSVLVPQGKRVTALNLSTPETPDPRRLDFKEVAGAVEFQVPEFLVYGLIRIELADASGG